MKTTKLTSPTIALKAFVLIMFMFACATAQAQKAFGPKFGHLTLKTMKLRPVISPEIPLESMNAEDQLIGQWFVHYSAHRDTVFLEKRKQGELRWGNYMHFMPDGKFAKGYSAPCGNDTNIHRHTGSWKTKGKLGTIITSLPEQKYNKIYRLEQGSAKQLMLILR